MLLEAFSKIHLPPPKWLPAFNMSQTNNSKMRLHDILFWGNFLSISVLQLRQMLFAVGHHTEQGSWSPHRVGQLVTTQSRAAGHHTGQGSWSPHRAGQLVTTQGRAVGHHTG
jgi:hypothetical protein